MVDYCNIDNKWSSGNHQSGFQDYQSHSRFEGEEVMASDIIMFITGMIFMILGMIHEKWIQVIGGFALVLLAAIAE